MELTVNTRAFIYSLCISIGVLFSFVGISLLIQGIFWIEYKAIFVGLSSLFVGLFFVFFVFNFNEVKR